MGSPIEDLKNMESFLRESDNKTTYTMKDVRQIAVRVCMYEKKMDTIQKMEAGESMEKHIQDLDVKLNELFASILEKVDTTEVADNQLKRDVGVIKAILKLHKIEEMAEYEQALTGFREELNTLRNS